MKIGLRFQDHGNAKLSLLVMGKKQNQKHTWCLDARFTNKEEIKSLRLFFGCWRAKFDTSYNILES